MTRGAVRLAFTWKRWVPATNPAPPARAAIAWSLGLVAAVHLLTTPGQWLVTDQKEYISVAERILDRGSLHLAEAGEPRRADLPWVAPPPPGEPQRSRLLPLTSVVLVPLVALDQAVSTSRPAADRPLVHLQGHVFVLAGLALAGAAAAAHGASVPGIVAAVALAGLSWPVWQASRRGGPEALFVFLVGLFAFGDALDRSGRRGGVPLTVAAALLPWGNPTGAVLAAVLLAGAAAARRMEGSSLRGLVLPALACAASCTALVGVWNHGYHGSFWLGGYATHYAPAGSVVDPGRIARGLLLHLASIAVDAGPLVAVAVAGVVTRRLGGAALAVPVAATASMVALFAAFPEPEPTRRLVAGWPAWGVAAGREFAALLPRSAARHAMVAAAGLLGFYGFWATEGRYHEGPGGLFYPSVLWVRLWIEGAPSGQYGLPVVALTAALAVAAFRTARLLEVASADA
jgi:hypothetical protein